MAAPDAWPPHLRGPPPAPPRTPPAPGPQIHPRTTSRPHPAVGTRRPTLPAAAPCLGQKPGAHYRLCWFADIHRRHGPDGTVTKATVPRFGGLVRLLFRGALLSWAASWAELRVTI